jgi:hypothetical protein
MTDIHGESLDSTVARPSDLEIEITPEMTEAGARVLSEADDSVSIWAARAVVQDIFSAMLATADRTSLLRWISCSK